MQPYFPMFLNLNGWNVLVAGGGKIGCRRVRTLLKFGARISIIAPEICEELIEIVNECREQIRVERRPWVESDLYGMQMVLAATNDREVNRQIVSACRDKGIPVNAADDKRLCDFYFPSIVMDEEIVIGINSGGEDPVRTKNVRKKIETMISQQK